VCAVCVLPSPYTDTLPPTHTAHKRTLPVRSLAPLAHASHPRADGKAGKNNDGRVECNVARVLRTRKRESIALTANHILVTMKLSTTFSAFAATVLAVSSRGVQAQNPACKYNDLDFSGLQGKSFKPADEGGYSYDLTICGESSKTCPNDPDGVISGSMVQTKGAGWMGECFVLGQYDDTAVWGPDSDGANVTMDNGCPAQCPDGLPRKLILEFVCAATPIPPDSDIKLADSGSCVYTVTIPTSYACASPPPPPKPPPLPQNISSDLASMNPHEIRVPANPSLAFGLIEHYSTISYDNDQFELYDRPSKELVATGQVISRGGDNESAVVASFEGACLALTTDSPPQVALNSWCKCKSVFSMYEGNNKSNVVCHYKLGMGPGSEGTVTGVYIVQRPAEARMVKEEGASKNLRGV
jgi:hypothetical protein